MSESEHYLAIPRSGSGRGVLVLHSWWGLNPFFRSVCDRLASKGFVALAPDLYGGKVADTPAAARRLRASATAGRKEPVHKFLIREIEYLRRHEAVTGATIGQLGFSMGGHWAFWLAQRAELPIRATVTFYAARSGDFSQSRSAFLCHFAEDDDWVSSAAMKKLARHLDAARAGAAFHQYPGTKHWFFESDRADAFEPKSADLAWKRTVGFFKRSLPPGKPRRKAATRRDSLLQLTQQVEALIACVRAVDAGRLPVYSRWTAKDVLCHVTFWHESFARNLSAVANHQKPPLLKGTLATLNQQGVDELRSHSVDQLVARLLAAHAGIQAVILDPAIGLIPYRRGSRPYTPDEHLEMVRAHIRRHTADIKAASVRFLCPARRRVS